MKAIVIIPRKEGGTLEMRDVPEPKPAAGQILLRVKATALNRADLYQRQGLHPTHTDPGSVLRGRTKKIPSGSDQENCRNSNR